MQGSYDVRDAVGPLRLVFWGGLLCVLDFKINNFDILNDFLGAILIAVGVARLARFPVHERYLGWMLFVKVIAIIHVFTAFFAMFTLHLSEPIAFLLTAFSLATLAATIAFCVAMRWLCIDSGLDRSAQSWQLTTILVTVLLAAPSGLLALVGLFARGSKTHWHIEFPIIFLMLAAVLVPVIHFFISTSRMRREAEGGGHYPGGGFPVVTRPPDE